MGEEAFEVAKMDGFESPIEQRLHSRLEKFFPGQVQKQKTIGRYRVDLFIPPNFVIECDGADYHRDRNADGQRDHALRGQGYIVIRCSGKLIHYCPAKVASQVNLIIQFYKRLKDPASRSRTWRIYEFDQVKQYGER
jgi:very-short-patch-repair endonuclease